MLSDATITLIAFSFIAAFLIEFWVIRKMEKMKDQRDAVQILIGDLISAVKNQSAATEKVQEQIAKLAANQLATQTSMDGLKNLPDWQKQVENQIDMLKADVEAKTKSNPQVRPSRWSRFKAEVENNA